MLTIKQFVELVAKMRASQKAYYKERKQSDLISSKQLEKAVDEALAKGIDTEVKLLDLFVQPDPDQPTLWSLSNEKDPD